MNSSLGVGEYRVGGIRVHSLPHADVLERMEQNISGPRTPTDICITNTESMFFARRLPEHRAFIDRAGFSLCDGMGVVLAGRCGGKRITRFNGPILVLEACRYGVERGWRHYFCGGREGVADALASRLQERFPGLVVAGTYCPPFRALSADEEAAMIATINESRPDILWVGLGLLKQEAFITRYADRLDVPWRAGVGAAFDYHAGTARWAPAPIRRLGLEWLYRLFFEPRMLIRNARSFGFMFQAGAEELAGRMLGGGEVEGR